MLGDNPFCNQIVNSVFHLFNESMTVPTASQVNYFFDQSPKSSKLRLFLAHALAYDFSPAAFARCVPKLDLEVCRAIAEVSVAEQSMNLNSKKPDARERCIYHVHEDREVKC